MLCLSWNYQVACLHQISASVCYLFYNIVLIYGQFEEQKKRMEIIVNCLQKLSLTSCSKPLLRDSMASIVSTVKNSLHLHNFQYVLRCVFRCI